MPILRLLVLRQPNLKPVWTLINSIQAKMVLALSRSLYCEWKHRLCPSGRLIIAWPPPEAAVCGTDRTSCYVHLPPSSLQSPMLPPTKTLADPPVIHLQFRGMSGMTRVAVATAPRPVCENVG
jgi:hypothetical protein